MNLVLAAASGGGFPDPLPVRELFELPAIFGEGTLLEFSRTSLLMLLSAAIVCGLMLVAFREPRVVPGRFQSAMESIVEFVRSQIIIQVIGPSGLRYLPLLTSMFLFIFVNNFYEVMPLVQFPTTGRMAIPAMLAIMVWTLFILAGLKAQGPKYFINAIIPPGVPGWLKPVVAIIEIISTFIVRPLTLAIRLFANMMAGHILLAVIFLAANAFLIDVHAFPSVSFNLKGSPIGLVTLAAGPAMVAFEIMVGALQAYIFTILTAVYISSSLEAH